MPGLFPIHRFERVLVQEVGLDAAQARAVVELDADVVVERADGGVLGDEEVFGLG